MCLHNWFYKDDNLNRFWNRYFDPTVFNNKQRICQKCGLVQESHSVLMDDWWGDEGYAENKDEVIRIWKAQAKKEKEASETWRRNNQIEIKNTIIPTSKLVGDN